MRGQKLGVKQLKSPRSQPMAQKGQGDLGPVRHPREHGFTKERSPQRHAIDPADQATLGPHFKAMGVAHLVKLAIKPKNLVIDPGLWPVSAAAQHAVEIGVYGDGKAAPRITSILESLPAKERLLNKSFWSKGGQFKAPWDTSK
jgi:hypothetical protein